MLGERDGAMAPMRRTSRGRGKLMKPKKRVCKRDGCEKSLGMKSYGGYCSKVCKSFHIAQITAAMNRWLKELGLVPLWGDSSKR